MRARNQGFTLIELLVAMAILAVVSLMAVQALSGVVFQRSVLTRLDDQAADLARTLALLRHDLEAVVPVPRLGDDGAGLPAIALEGGTLLLMRGGLAPLPGEAAVGFASVEWRLEGGILTRQMTLGNADPSPRITLLEGLTDLRLSALGGTLPTAEAPTVLPAGLVVELTHARHGTIRLVVAR